MTFELSIDGDLGQFVSQQMAEGTYASFEDIVKEGLSALRERTQARQRKLEQLRNDIEIGLAQIEAGKTRVLDETVLEEIKSKGRERLKAKGLL